MRRQGPKRQSWIWQGHPFSGGAIPGVCRGGQNGHPGQGSGCSRTAGNGRSQTACAVEPPSARLGLIRFRDGFFPPVQFPPPRLGLIVNPASIPASELPLPRVWGLCGNSQKHGVTLSPPRVWDLFSTSRNRASASPFPSARMGLIKEPRRNHREQSFLLRAYGAYRNAGRRCFSGPFSPPASGAYPASLLHDPAQKRLRWPLSVTAGNPGSPDSALKAAAQAQKAGLEPHGGGINPGVMLSWLRPVLGWGKTSGLPASMPISKSIAPK